VTEGIEISFRPTSREAGRRTRYEGFVPYPLLLRCVVLVTYTDDIQTAKTHLLSIGSFSSGAEGRQHATRAASGLERRDRDLVM
jgi:hypothetical protein